MTAMLEECMSCLCSSGFEERCESSRVSDDAIKDNGQVDLVSARLGRRWQPHVVTKVT